MEFLGKLFSQPIKTLCILGRSKLLGQIQYLDMTTHILRELGKHKTRIYYAETNQKLLSKLSVVAQNMRMNLTSTIPFHSSILTRLSLFPLQVQSYHDRLMHMMKTDIMREIFNIISLAESKFHTVNIDNFFSDIFNFLDHKLISHSTRNMLISVNTFVELFQKLQAYISVQNSVELRV